MMMPRHPLEAVPAGHRGRAFGVALALTLLLGFALRALDPPLRTEAAPLGIVSFEFAGSVAGAERMLASWDAAARRNARLGLLLDFAYLVAYSTTIALACLGVARRLRGPLPLAAIPGRWLAWAQWGAALLDAIENVALLLVLSGGGGPWPRVALVSAVLKFAGVALGLLYVILGTLLLVAHGLRRGKDRAP